MQRGCHNGVAAEKRATAPLQVRPAGALSFEEVKAVYTMAVAERLTGLTQRQIRYYEARGLIRLARGPSGQRLLTAEDIRQLRRIRWLLQQGHNVHTMRVLLGAGDALGPGGESTRRAGRRPRMPTPARGSPGQRGTGHRQPLERGTGPVTKPVPPALPLPDPPPGVTARPGPRSRERSSIRGEEEPR